MSHPLGSRTPRWHPRFTAALVLLAGAAPAAAQDRALVTPTAGIPASAPVPPRPLTREDVDAGTLRAGPVRFDAAFLAELRRAFAGSFAAPPRAVTVSPFPDVTFTLVLRRSASAAAASGELVVLSGEVKQVRETGVADAQGADVQGSYTLVLHGGELTLSIHSSAGNYHVRRGLDGRLEAFQENPAAPVQCADAAPPAAHAAQATSPGDAPRAPGDSSEVVVLVLYTDAAVSAIGGDAAALQAEVTKGVDLANTAFRNSGVRLTARLATGRAVRVPASFGGAARFADDLRALQSSAEVAALRRLHRADVVMLARGQGDTWTVAGRLAGAGAPAGEGGFGVVYARKLADGLAFAHALGHALGAGHDPSHVDRQGLFPYARAWHGGIGVDARRSAHVGTIMSHVGQRIPYFSTPNARYRGVPVGSADQDNARAIDAARATVAAYQP